MLWLLLMLAIAVAAAYYRWSRRRLHQLARKIPSGIRAYPIVGHAYIFRGNSEDRMTELQKFGHRANQYGGLVHAWLANRLFIAMTDPKAIELVLKTCLDKDEFTTKFTRTVIGNAMTFAPVKIWHTRRKIMTPFFKPNNVKQAVRIFDEQSTIMSKLMETEVGGGDFPIWKYFTTYTFDTVCETAIGVKMRSQVNRDHFLLQAIDQLTRMIAARILQPWLHPDFIYRRVSVYQEFIRHRKIAYDYIEEVLKNKREKIGGTVESESKDDRQATFLDTIMESSAREIGGYSDEELREETMIYIIAGNDTSAAGSGFTAVVLSRYPDVQDKVYQELLEVFGDSDRAVTPEDLSRLKYLEAVIKETLRLYPPAPIIVREVHKDVVLPSGTTLVAGTSVVVHIWGTHRNPEYWGADAEQFRPERFLEAPLPHPAMFIPFSHSVRGCIGSVNAMLLMKTGLANLLRRYRLLPPANMAAAELRAPLRVRFDIMMKAVDDFVVRIEKRNKIM